MFSRNKSWQLSEQFIMCMSASQMQVPDIGCNTVNISENIQIIHGPWHGHSTISRNKVCEASDLK